MADRFGGGVHARDSRHLLSSSCQVSRRLRLRLRAARAVGAAWRSCQSGRDRLRFRRVLLSRVVRLRMSPATERAEASAPRLSPPGLRLTLVKGGDVHDNAIGRTLGRGLQEQPRRRLPLPQLRVRATPRYSHLELWRGGAL
jgi:hypothetical protein